MNKRVYYYAYAELKDFMCAEIYVRLHLRLLFSIADVYKYYHYEQDVEWRNRLSVIPKLVNKLSSILA